MATETEVERRAGEPATAEDLGAGAGDGARALLVVDVQNDFCPGGALPVGSAHEVAEAIAAHLASTEENYAAVVFTRDWHVDPGSHFAPEGTEPDFSETWPPHCVAGTEGAAFHRAVADRVERGVVVSKGRNAAAYSGFEGAVDTGEGRGQPLDEYLRSRGVTQVDVCGLATDYCVAATATDASESGYGVRVLVDLSGGIDPDSTARALTRLVERGVDLALVRAESAL